MPEVPNCFQFVRYKSTEYSMWDWEMLICNIFKVNLLVTDTTDLFRWKIWPYSGLYFSVFVCCSSVLLDFWPRFFNSVPHCPPFTNLLLFFPDLDSAYEHGVFWVSYWLYLGTWLLVWYQMSQVPVFMSSTLEIVSLYFPCNLWLSFQGRNCERSHLRHYCL